MEAATYETLQRNLPSLPEDMDVQIMHDVSRGLLSFYRRAVPMQNDEPTVVISAYPLDLHQGGSATLYDTGVKVVVPPQRSIPSRLLDPKMKTRSRQHYMIADLQVRDVDPSAWALLTDEDGFLTEGTGANVFLVKKGALLTPEPRDILRGISRAYVMELAAKLGIPCHERNLEPYDLHTADEAFFTSTRFCLWSITHLDGLPIGKAAPGPIAKRLLAAWSKEVGVDIAAQARAYAKLSQRPA
jgi:branched-chain amino acid aminotransferase